LGSLFKKKGEVVDVQTEDAFNEELVASLDDEAEADEEKDKDDAGACVTKPRFYFQTMDLLCCNVSTW
jgi:purine nucleoside phosphorylase